MSFVHTARRAAVVLAAVALGACGDSTAPTIDNIDASAAATASAPVIAVMDQQELAGFESLGGTAGLEAVMSTSASAAAVGAVTRLTSVAATGRWDGLAPTLARSAARSADVLPTDVRGNMYVYNRTTESYEVSNNPDADVPANGVRIVLYAWDFTTSKPSNPLTRVAHVDLIDQSNAAQNQLRVLVVRETGNVTLMDYTITHTVSASSESFSIAGSATNGTTPLTFNLSGTASETAATITFDLAAQSVGFSVHVGANVNATTQQATVETRLGYNGHTLSFRLTGSPNRIDGEIKFDGMRYATLTIVSETSGGTTTTTTTFVKANGQPLTVEEVEQIQSVFERALDFDEFWEALLRPVAALSASPI